MEKLIKQHYNAIVDRGKINLHTTNNDFIDKIVEEYIEFMSEYLTNKQNLVKGNLTGKTIQEAIDLVMASLNFLQFNGIDIKEAIRVNLEYQRTRSKSEN